MRNPFIDFYNKYNIIPTSQNLNDFKNFLNQRNQLYSNLGLPLTFIKNKDVIEFGPGGGWNATATSFFQPSSYTFVDGSITSIKEIKNKIINKKFNSKVIKIYKTNIFKFKSKKKYDVVIIEGTVPNQIHPEKMLKIVSNSLKKGGILITTTHSPLSLLPEVCRRLMRIKIYNTIPEFNERLIKLSKIFKSHLKTLKAFTRPVEDWVSDVILSEHSYKNKYDFDLLNTLDCLKKEFYFYNSQPKFLIDDVWHKHVKKNQDHSNNLLIKQYKKNSIFLIDYRVSFKNLTKNKDFLKNINNIDGLCRKLIKIHNEIIKDNSYKNIKKFLITLNQLKNLLPREFDVTKKSIECYIEDLPKFIKGDNKNLFKNFKKWWGRGMQYSSFIKKFIKA